METEDISLNDSCNNETLAVDPDILSFTDTVCKINLLMMSIGVIGNILCIHVFSKKKMIIRKFNWYLLVLSVFEIIFCLIIFIDYLYRVLNNIPVFLHDLNDFTKSIFDFIIHTTDSFILLITLILSIDRLLAIKDPIKAKYFITNTRSKCLLTVNFIILVLLRIPGVIICHLDFQGNTAIIFCTFINPLIFNIIPTITILVLNSLLVLEILNYYRNKSRMMFYFHGSQNKKTSLKRSISQSQKSHYFVILIVAIWTVLTSIPYYALNTYVLLFRIEVLENLLDAKKIIITQAITSIFFNLNHCINFLIYFSFYKQFRHSTIYCFSKTKQLTYIYETTDLMNR
jgi:hypothetical protein